MPDIWFTADLHLNHANTLNFPSYADPSKPMRSFGSVEEMNETIISRFNERVKPHDVVYILGDLAMTKTGVRMVDKLKGRKRLVLGNHEDGRLCRLYGEMFERVYGCKYLNGFLLTHIPVHPSSLGRPKGKVNVHGHLHDRRVMHMAPETSVYRDSRYFCVSVEQNDYRPFHWEDLRDHAIASGLLDPLDVPYS